VCHDGTLPLAGDFQFSASRRARPEQRAGGLGAARASGPGGAKGRDLYPPAVSMLLNEWPLQAARGMLSNQQRQSIISYLPVSVVIAVILVNSSADIAVCYRCAGIYRQRYSCP
jgi:hypothetical protein